MTTCRRCGTVYPEQRLPTCPICVLEADLPPLVLGDSIELLEEIGRGGMGTVYRGRHLRLGRDVAVKILPDFLAADPSFRSRLEREARTLARLQHPAIVAVHDLGRDGDQSFIVMELVEGQPLSDLIPVAFTRAVAITRQICDALAYAHEHGVVHRDLKPQNVIVGSGDQIKVADFGIARFIERKDEGLPLTASGVAIGTPPYMSPEAKGGSAPDPSMDVYSLGVMLHEMLAGRRPAGDIDIAVGPLERVVRRALEPRREDRYGSIDELRSDLEAVVAAAQTTTSTGDAAVDPAPVDTTSDLADRSWLRAVAVLETLASAAVLWALVRSLTPRVLAPGGIEPLIMVGAETLADGRVLSRARFETVESLVAMALVAVGIAGYGLLVRYWASAGLLRPQPDRPIPESQTVLMLGVLAVLVFALRRGLEWAGHGGLSTYIPIVGGLIEIGVLYAFWSTLLEAWRTSRPLRREPKLWNGLGLALVPPVVDMIRHLSSWQP